MHTPKLQLTRRTSLTRADKWERAWQRHWRAAGLPDYELPPSDDAAFLQHTRSEQKGRARLKRVNDEFVRAFNVLQKVGPAVTVFGSARFKENNRYYQMAREVGAELARVGFATLTGGGPGLMEAANRGAQETGGPSYGLNIVLPHEQEGNSYVDRGVNFRYFFTRKVCLVKYSCAYIVLPGGLGTLDELFEAATLIQCRKIGPFPLILMGTEFWAGLQKWGQLMMEEGVFSKEEIGFGLVTDSPKEAVELVRRSLPPALQARLKPLE